MEMHDTIDSEILLTNIQRFSLHDGPGIRTTVFLKGCPLKCPWCCNPENQSYEPEKYIKDGKQGKYGKKVSCEKLYREVMKDKKFYSETSNGALVNDFNVKDITDLDKLPGGITFSGGETLAQVDGLVPLLRRLHEDRIHMAVETCLFVSPRQLNTALVYIDLFYVDVKIMNEVSCMEVLHGDLRLYFRNLDILFSWRDEARHKKPVVIRVPVIGGFTDSDTNRNAVVELVRKYNPVKVEIIKEHSLGISKYKSLGMQAPNYKGVDDELMERYKEEIEITGVPVEICKI